jgi:hypothetical protein
MPRPSHPSWLDYSNYTWRRVQVMKFLIFVFISVDTSSSCSDVIPFSVGCCLIVADLAVLLCLSLQTYDIRHMYSMEFYGSVAHSILYWVPVSQFLSPAIVNVLLSAVCDLNASCVSICYTVVLAFRISLIFNVYRLSKNNLSLRRKKKTNLKTKFLKSQRC